MRVRLERVLEEGRGGWATVFDDNDATAGTRGRGRVEGVGEVGECWAREGIGARRKDS